MGITFLVIGFIAAAVVGGRQVLHNAELNSVTQDIGDITKASAEFERLYGGLPGDLADATTRIGASANGNGNGLIETPNSDGVNEELLFWQHLKAANLLKGAGDGTGYTPGSGIKSSKIRESAAFGVMTDSSGKLMVTLAGYTGGAGGYAVLSPKDALQIDRKYDDGNPATGLIRASIGTSAVGNCLTGGAYDVGNSGVACKLDIFMAKSETAAETTATTATCPGGISPGTTRTLNCPSPPYDASDTYTEVCRIDGVWEFASGACNVTVPQCPLQTLSCGAAGVNCDFVATNVGSSYTPTCPGGYMAGGTAPSRTCAAGAPPSWGALTGACIPAVVDCSMTTLNCGVGDVAPTCSFPAADDGDPSTATCPAGYTGTPVRTCTTGTLGALSGGCTADPCTTQSLSCGSGQNCSFTGVASGVQQTSTCPAGYTGAPKSTCTAGTWGAVSDGCTPEPCTTQSLNCGGGQTCSFAGVASGSSSTAACPAGYDGTPQRTCTNGSWGALGGTSCAPAPCATQSLDCGNAQTCSFASIASGNTRTATCPAGYTGTPQRTCTNGSWGALSGSCDPVSCSTEPSYPNVIITGSGTTPGSTRTARCDASTWYWGMPTTLTCQADGTWSTNAPTCFQLDCSGTNCNQGTPTECTDPATCATKNCAAAPPAVGGTYETLSGAGTGYANYRDYTCDTCFSSQGGQNSRVMCDNGNNWRGNANRCVPATLSTVTNGSIAYAKVGSQWVGTVTCNAGFTLVGSQYTTCTSGTTSWTPPGVCQTDKWIHRRCGDIYGLNNLTTFSATKLLDHNSPAIDGGPDAIAYNHRGGSDAKWVAILDGTNYNVATSPDGITWTSSMTPTFTATVSKVASNEQTGASALWVATIDRTIWTSTDTLNWTLRYTLPAGTLAGQNFGGLAHNGQSGASSMWMATIDQDNSGSAFFVKSVDGISWDAPAALPIDSYARNPLRNNKEAGARNAWMWVSRTGAYFSYDNGATWESVGGTHQSKGTGHNHLTGGESVWFKGENGTATPAQAIQYSGKPYPTASSGASWTTASAPNQNKMTTEIESNGVYGNSATFANPSTVLAVAQGLNGWVKSTDGGVTWGANIYYSNSASVFCEADDTIAPIFNQEELKKRISWPHEIFFKPDDSANGFLGASVAAAGDVNGDGFQDFLISRPVYQNGASANTGEVWLVFGRQGWRNMSGSATYYLGAGAQDGYHAVRFLGSSGSKYLGSGISGAGDVNNDGYDDILIGAWGDNGDPDGTTIVGAGSAYLVYGRQDWSSSTYQAWLLPTKLGGLLANNPIMTLNGSPTLYVYYPAHGLVSGDKVVLNGATATGGIVVGNINTSFTVTNGTPQVAFANNPIRTTSGSNIVRFTKTGHGLIAGESITISGAGAVGGITAANLNTTFTVTNYIDANTFEVTAATNATSTVAAGGGNAVVLQYNHKFSVTAAANATSNAVGGGALVTIANTSRGVKFLGRNADRVAEISTAGGPPPNFVSVYTYKPLSSAGDVNGDGYDDFLISANNRAPGGATYLILGQASYPAVDHISLNPASYSFVREFDGDAAAKIGGTAAGAGDVNGDGYDDFLLSKTQAPNVYLVFGKAAAFPATTALIGLNGTTGVVLHGANDGDGIAIIGDVNSDGYDDIAIGSPWTNSVMGQVNAGSTYIVFGKAGAWSSPLDVSTVVNGTAGVRVDGFNQAFGSNASARAGNSVSGLGDVNGDGIDDFIIGAHMAAGTAGGDVKYGNAYVIFGKTDWSATAGLINVNSLDGTNGFILAPSVAQSRYGTEIAGLGDINGDGIPDFAIGSPGDGSAGVFGARVYLSPESWGAYWMKAGAPVFGKKVY